MSSGSISIWKRLIASYVGIFIIFTTTFLLLFQISFISIQKIFFYKGLFFLSVTSLLCLIGIIFYAEKSRKNIESLFAALMISIAINLSIFIMFPVTFERSVTIFMLSTLEHPAPHNSCQGLTKKQMEAALINTYIVRNNAVSKRVAEQEVIKNVETKSQCLALTKSGRRFLDFSRFLSRLYNLQLPTHTQK